jgi:Tfp pilus assembly protein PilF
MSAGPALSDSFERYHRVGLAAEKSGQIDRALGLYSRSYARNPAFRPTLERLSEICFERQQWDNAWKATEHLLERHGTDLDAETRAELALRSALADLHIAQRAVAANRIAAMLAGPPKWGKFGKRGGQEGGGFTYSSYIGA